MNLTTLWYYTIYIMAITIFLYDWDDKSTIGINLKCNADIDEYLIVNITVLIELP